LKSPERKKFILWCFSYQTWIVTRSR